MQNGGSSFALVRRTIDCLQRTGIPFGVECTYNAQHLDAGFSVRDLMDYFYAEAGVEQVHIPPVSLPRPFEPLAVKKQERQDTLGRSESRAAERVFFYRESGAPVSGRRQANG